MMAYTRYTREGKQLAKLFKTLAPEPSCCGFHIHVAQQTVPSPSSCWQWVDDSIKGWGRLGGERDGLCPHKKASLLKLWSLTPYSQTIKRL